MTWYTFEGLFNDADYRTRSTNKLLQYMDDKIDNESIKVHPETYQQFEMVLHGLRREFLIFTKITVLYTPSSLYLVRDTDQVADLGSFVINVRPGTIKVDVVLPGHEDSMSANSTKYDAREFPFERVKQQLHLLES